MLTCMCFTHKMLNRWRRLHKSIVSISFLLLAISSVTVNSIQILYIVYLNYWGYIDPNSKTQQMIRWGQSVIHKYSEHLLFCVRPCARCLSQCNEDPVLPQGHAENVVSKLDLVMVTEKDSQRRVSWRERWWVLTWTLRACISKVCLDSDIQ